MSIISFICQADRDYDRKRMVKTISLNHVNCEIRWTIRIEGALACLWLFLLYFQFSAENPPSVITCEGSTTSISCQNGKTIKVLDANYGRLNRHTCIDNNMNDVYCTSSNSLGIVQQKCDHKTSCRVSASNSVFGDPCVGTYKYLEVKYQCSP